MDSGLYDPPLASSSLRSTRRGRSASFSASASAQPPLFSRASSTLNRRPSLSSLPPYSSAGGGGAGNLSDDEFQEQPLVDLGHSMDFPPNDPVRKSASAMRGRSLSMSSVQDPADAAADRKLQRDGRQSKASLLEEKPGLKMSGDMENFMAQLYDLTHSIDALENDVDEILSLRNKIVTLDPKVDVGQVSLRADLDSLSSLTTQTGKTIVNIETWLLQLHKWSKDVRKLVKSGQAGETMQEVGEIKFHLASAKVDFADAMERIREGAYKEQERRERTRIWMARHIRSREPEIEDRDVKGLLKAAELGAADGVAESHVTSYAGLWALQNPFTELAELTNGMRFLHDDLDRDIVDTVTGKKAKKRTIYLNGDPSSKKSKKSSSSKKSKSKSSNKPQISPGPPAQWFGSRYGFISTLRPNRSNPGSGEAAEFERKFRYIQGEQYAAEKDLEYGYARQAQLDRVNRRKKLVIALLLVIIAALILFVVLATMNVPEQKFLVNGNNNGTPSATESLPTNAAPISSDPWAVSAPTSSSTGGTTFTSTATSSGSSSSSSSSSSAATSTSQTSDSSTASTTGQSSSKSDSSASSSSASTATFNNGMNTGVNQQTNGAVPTAQATQTTGALKSAGRPSSSSMSSPSPSPSPLPSQTRQAQQLLLASFPLIALGVVGIGFATFLLSLGRVNRAHVNLWTSLGSAFLAGLFELINVLQTDPENPLRLFQLLPGLVIIDGIALGFFVNMKLFFLFRRVRQPGLYDPPTSNYPLPVSRDELILAAPARQEYGVVPPAVRRFVRPALWIAILSTGFVESTWRIGIRRDLNGFKKVYLASNAMQLILQVVFLLTVLVSAIRSRGRPRLYVFLSYLPFFSAILLGYIFLLETSLLDYKRPYRDSFSFERISTRSSTPPDGAADKEAPSGPPALSRSPLDRAALAAAEPFSALGALRSDRSGSRSRSESETTLASSAASTGTGPVLRRSSNLPSWLPVLRAAPAVEALPGEYAQERLSLTATAARPGWATAAAAADDKSMDASLLFVQAATEQQPIRIPQTSRTVETALPTTGDLSVYRFPESVGASGRTSEVQQGVAKSGNAEAEEEGKVVFPHSASLTTNSSTPSSSSEQARRARPVLTINTALSAPPSSSSNRTNRTSKPLPPVPPPAAEPQGPSSPPVLDTTSSTTTLRTLLPRFLPSALPHPTRPLDLPKPRPPPLPRNDSDTLPYLAQPAAGASFSAAAAANPRRSEPVSIASTARSSSATLGLGVGFEGGTGDAIDRFPYPPPTALIRTSSGRTGTTVSLGRVRTREGSEFDIVSPAGGGGGAGGGGRRMGFVAAAATAAAAGEEREEGGRRRSCNRLPVQESAGTGTGVDITSLIVGNDDADELQERLSGDSGSGSGSTPEGRESPVAGAGPLSGEWPGTPTPSSPRLPLYPPPRGLPSHPALSLPLPHRPTRIPPPRPWPPSGPTPAPPLFPRHPRNVSTASSSGTYVPSPPPSDGFYPPAPASGSRRPSAVSLAAARIRAEGESLLPRAVPAGAGGSDGSSGGGGRMRRFVFPAPGRRGEGGGGGGGGRERIVVSPERPFERPRRVPEVVGERFSPQKEEQASEGGAKGEASVDGEGEGEGGGEEGEVQEVVGVAVSREKAVVSPSGSSARWSAQ
ncbi:hypothetical protein JCM6882_005617 [Rhodosporidiobolus microsporus]